MKKIAYVLVIVFSLTALMDLCVFADEPPEEPTPYKIILENGTTFYMTPLGEENQICPKSGLYTNTNPPKPIYYAEPSDIAEDYSGYISEYEINLSNDGQYYAVLPYWVGDEDSDAVGFYKKGKLIKSYKASTLTLNKNKMEVTVSHVQWDTQNKRAFDNEHNLLTVYTREKNTIIFDITTGAIVKGYPKNGWQTFEGSKYYFDEDGGMLTKSKNIDGIRYKFDVDGVCQGKYTGWVQYSNGDKQYYKNGIKQP